MYISAIWYMKNSFPFYKFWDATVSMLVGYFSDLNNSRPTWIWLLQDDHVSLLESWINRSRERLFFCPNHADLTMGINGRNRSFLTARKNVIQILYPWNSSRHLQFKNKICFNLSLHHDAGCMIRSVIWNMVRINGT